MPVKRFILATSVCVIGGAGFLFCLSLIWIFFIQPDFEKASDLTVPKWIRTVFSFAFVFCATHFCAYLSPSGFRRHSALISAVTVTLLFFGTVLLVTYPFRSYLLVPVLLDFIPIGGGAFAAWFLHARKCA